jgi:uncharacterized protein (TIGR03435 family)
MRSLQFVLIVIEIVAAALPVFSQGPAETKPSFEVAAVKPSAPGTRMKVATQPGGRFVANDVPLALMIAAAYRVRDYQIIGAKGWIMTDRWSLEAKTAEGTVDPPSATPPFLNVPDIMAVRLRSLLEDRFELKTHRETREMQVYTLNVGKDGSKLKAVDPPAATPGDPVAPPAGARPPLRPNGTIPENFAPPPGATLAGPGTILASAITMDQIVLLLGRLMDGPVIDKTGLRGYFNVRLQFDPETAPRRALGATPANTPEVTPPAAGDPAGPSLFTALQEQLGLKLEPRKEPVEVLVIDSAQKPTEN